MADENDWAHQKRSRRNILNLGWKAALTVAGGEALLNLTGCGSGASTHTDTNTGQKKKQNGVPSLELERWGVCYNAVDDPNQLKGWDVLALDKDNGIDTTQIDRKTAKLAYISLGEIEGFRNDLPPDNPSQQATYDIAKKYSLGLKKSDPSDTTPPENIDLNSRVDVADLRKQGYYEDVIKPRILDAIKQGYDGVMLDTLDTALAVSKGSADGGGVTGNVTSVLYNTANGVPEMRQAAIDLVTRIKQDPDLRPNGQSLKIMVNRAFEIMPDLIAAKAVDMSMAEQTISDYGNYKALLDPIKQAGIKLYGVEYLDPATLGNPNASAVTDLYTKMAQAGIDPYVADNDPQTGQSLQKLYGNIQQVQFQKLAAKGIGTDVSATPTR